MTRRETLLYLIDYFAQEALKASEQGDPWCDTTDLCFLNTDAMTDSELFNTYRSLVNVRPPREVPDVVGKTQNLFLQHEIAAKGITDAATLFENDDDSYKKTVGNSANTGNSTQTATAISSTLPASSENTSSSNGISSSSKNLAVWQGDITTLKIDAIVNAANSQLLGCWSPCHACIDNCIHTYAGTDLRLACYEIMKSHASANCSAAPYEEPTGSAEITKAYNLPCRFVLHTVGPIVGGRLTERDCDLLASCYTSCLDLAEENALTSIAFCCISTGVFHFPNDRACSVAVTTVRKWLMAHAFANMRVVFNVFKNEDRALYEKELGKPAEA